MLSASSVTRAARLAGVGVALCLAVGASTASARSRTTASSLQDWPALVPDRPVDATAEARIASILATMSLRDKVAQMTQGEIQKVTPDDVRQYRLGSVLNGGGSWPAGNNPRAGVRDWLDLAQSYYDASMKTGATTPVPILWGTDAVHGHNNVFGATIFPHNIGLGAARDPALVGEIGAAVGQAVRATGIQWAFAPTLAVVRDSRWGRTYESFAEDPAVVEAYAKTYVEGLQGSLRGDGDVVATAKHYLGDGGTMHGVDQGVTRVTRSELIDIHARGYYAALRAGVQTVMVSYSSVTDAGSGRTYGKMHGNHELLTDVLKGRLGFDGFVVSDWDAIEQLPGCSKASCPAAINAGIDMVMVPNDWKAFIDNTVAQVERGVIPPARIDDAVRRILRVKVRAGLFERSPRASRYAGDPAALKADDLARHAVRESLVLLKNDGGVLPLRRKQRLLVVGRSADSLPAQTGGWSMTWQGTKTTNADFPGGVTVLAALRAANAGADVVHSTTGTDVDAATFDAVVVVLGEDPYAETAGDVRYPKPLSHALRYPADLAALRAVSGKGVPVVTVFLTGRVQYATDLINLSDAFVVAWLPGTQAGGIADVLLRDTSGQPAFDFRGRLPFAWPAHPCQTAFARQPGGAQPLFDFGHGLTYSNSSTLGRLAEAPAVKTCR